MYGPTMNGHRIFARSDQTERVIVVIMPNMYNGTVSSWAFADEYPRAFMMVGTV
jgi:hypothetical protein